MPKFQHEIPPAKLEAEVIAWTELAVAGRRETSQSPALKLFPRSSNICAVISGQPAYSLWLLRPRHKPYVPAVLGLVSLLTEGKPEPQIKVWDDTTTSLQSRPS